MMVEIKNSQEIDPTIKILIYGPSGVGKTVFAATAPDVLFLDAEGGMLSVADKKIDRIKINSFKDIKDAFMFLKNEKHDYKTVVIDSLTETQKKSMDEILKASGKDMPRIGDWGMNIEQIRRMVRNFRDLPMNVIITALEMNLTDEDEGISTKSPALQGKSLPQEVMGFMDVVGYMVAQEKKIESEGKGKKETEKKVVRAIRVQPTASINAKDRSPGGKLGIWVKPDFTEIYETVFGKPVTKKKKGTK